MSNELIKPPEEGKLILIELINPMSTIIGSGYLCYKHCLAVFLSGYYLLFNKIMVKIEAKLGEDLTIPGTLYIEPKDIKNWIYAKDIKMEDGNVK